MISRATLKNIKQNLFFALIYNVLGIPLAALGYLSPVLAGAAMAMSSLSVLSNALRLKRVKIKEEKGDMKISPFVLTSFVSIMEVEL